MKNTSNNDLLFLAPIVAIFTLAITIAAALYFKNNGTQYDANTSATESSGAYSQSGALNRKPNNSTSTGTSNGKTNDHSVASHYKNFSMAEPFAEHVPFEFTPAAWIQMMNTFMNNMQITQMMHQMAAMPTQMMSPTMWQNPHAMLPMDAANPSKPMDPKDYKIWYEQQVEAMKQDKK